MHDGKELTRFVVFSFNAAEWVFIIIISGLGLVAVIAGLIQTKNSLMLLATLTMLIVAAISLSFHRASLNVNESGFKYATGLRSLSFTVEEIKNAAIISAGDFPAISYKRWAYALPGRKNGLFAMRSGRRAWVSGTAEKYLFIELQNYDLYLAINEERFNNFAEALVPALATREK